MAANDHRRTRHQAHRAHIASLTTPVEMQPIADAWQRTVRQIIAEAEESDQFNDSFREVLSLHRKAAQQMYSDTGMGLIDSALHDLAMGRGVGGIDTNGDHCAAARIIDSHSWFADIDLENESRGSAIVSFDKEIGHVLEWERQHQTLLAIIEIWWRLAPMLNDTGAGRELIQRLSEED